ncbi:DUF4365 domain-containing protein [Streptomyces sp. LBL]|uniref:DUF4365 domain-containing protein n=1 Tax=Streptomyces sp. LBL TaxID=2940562 RepID=UPI0024752638|nr:DUF4365 domain-containing protein [Streptomyces sp. LBL]
MAWISHLVTSELGWIFREQTTVDVGIDAHLEVLDSATSKATGQLLGVQIKSGLSYFGSATDGGWWFTCNAAHASYWLGHSLPVLVMLYNPVTRRVYWQHVTRWTAVVTGKGWKVFVPEDQELSAQSVQDLRPLARSTSEISALKSLFTWGVEGDSKSSLWERDIELYRHLLSARLHMLFPEVVATKDVRIDTSPVDMEVWLTIGLIVEVALIHPSSRLDKLLDKSTYAYEPLLIVVCGARDLNDCPQLQKASFEAPLFCTAWSPEAGDDESLIAAMEAALRWMDPPLDTMAEG